jgi:mono/diheme cytochrome c family protein
MSNVARLSTRCARFGPTAATIVATFGLSARAWADEASEARAGQELAAKICSPCHVVGETPGPPFAEIAKGERAAPEALRDFLHATHSNMSHPGAMPNPELTDAQIEEIAAYLATLRAAK